VDRYGEALKARDIEDKGKNWEKSIYHGLDVYPFLPVRFYVLELPF
jgi:hypothetical protein